MPAHLETVLDIQQQLQQQIFNLSPKAFRLFACNFLVHTGLENITIIRSIGNTGIEARGELIKGIFRLPTRVLVKRHHKNVQRNIMDEFNNVLTRHTYAQGLFLTTANFAPAALKVALSANPPISTLNGEQITTIMIEKHLGVVFLDEGIRIDQDYFAAFEQHSVSLTEIAKNESKNKLHNYL